MCHLCTGKPLRNTSCEEQGCGEPAANFCYPTKQFLCKVHDANARMRNQQSTVVIVEPTNVLEPPIVDTPVMVVESPPQVLSADVQLQKEQKKPMIKPKPEGVGDISQWF